MTKNVTQRNENVLRRPTIKLPGTLAPAGFRCVQMMIPDDNEHMAALAGMVTLLTHWTSWERDPNKGGTIAAQAWQNAINRYPLFRTCTENTTVTEESEYLMSICEQLRWNNGKLQGLCCGEWTDIPGQGDSTLGGSGQPGEGAHQPGYGETECYNGTLAGTGLWHLPTVVNSGDTIEVTEYSGAWHDGAFTVWRCPNGYIDFAGGCVPSTATESGDPLPSDPHMSLIAEIQGTFYPVLTGGVFTVPGGVSNAEVTFQANDSVLSDNAGEIAFTVCVENNQSAGWEHTFDFLASDCGFVSNPINRAVWTAGQGWGIDPSGSYPGLFQIQAPVVAARDYNFWQAFLTLSPNGVLPNVGIGLSDYTGTVYAIDPHGALNPSIGFGSTNGTSFWSSIQSDPHDTVEGGVLFTGKLYKLVVKGPTGTDPF